MLDEQLERLRTATHEAMVDERDVRTALDADREGLGGRRLTGNARRSPQQASSGRASGARRGSPRPGLSLQRGGYLRHMPPQQTPLGRPRSFRGGRLQVYGCSPGCLFWSLLLSVGLTILINLLIKIL